MAEEQSEKEVEELVRQFTDSKQTLHSFMTNVVKSDDTTKTGNLSEEELGSPKLPVRTTKELELFCRDIAGDDEWGDYFQKLSEIQTSTSLSKQGLLMRLAVTIKKELADMTPQEKKKNKGWFAKKEDNQIPTQ